jgi:hypothetical protein
MALSCHKVREALDWPEEAFLMFVNIRNCAAFIIILVSAPFSYGETTVWLSNNAMLSDMDLTTAAPVGTRDSFDIWIRTDHIYTMYNISLDLMTLGGAIEFTAGEIVIGPDRFLVQRTPMVAQDGAILSGMWGFAGIGGAILGTGIGPGVRVDDESLRGYRFATIHYRVIGQGTSDLQLKVGTSGFGWNIEHDVLQLGVDDPVTENVPGSTDTIIDGRIHVVPEACSVVLLLIGSILILMWRSPARMTFSDR